jgi:hypothetical protein
MQLELSDVAASLVVSSCLRSCLRSSVPAREGAMLPVLDKDVLVVCVGSHTTTACRGHISDS